ALPHASRKDRNPSRLRTGQRPGVRLLSRILLPPSGDAEHARYAGQPAELFAHAAGSGAGGTGRHQTGESDQAGGVGLLPAAALSEFGGFRTQERNSFGAACAVDAGRAGSAALGAAGGGGGRRPGKDQRPGARALWRTAAAARDPWGIRPVPAGTAVAD